MKNISWYIARTLIMIYLIFIVSCGNPTSLSNTAPNSIISASIVNTNNGVSNTLSTSSASFSLTCNSALQTSLPSTKDNSFYFDLPNAQTCILSLNSFTLSSSGESFQVATTGQKAQIGAGTLIGTYLGSLGTNATITPRLNAILGDTNQQTLGNGSIIEFNYQTFTIDQASLSQATLTPTATTSSPFYSLMGVTNSLAASFVTTSNSLSGLSIGFLDTQFSASNTNCINFSLTSACNLNLSLRSTLPSFRSNSISLNNTGSYLNNYYLSSNITSMANATFANSLSYSSLNSSTASVSYPYLTIHPHSAFTASYGNGCTIDNSGYLWCWGPDVLNQLTDGNSNSMGPVRIRNCVSASSPSASCATNYMTGVISVHIGYQFICSLLNTGQVYCWGWNNWKQTGQPTGGSTSQPTLVSGLSNVIAIGGNQIATCAIIGSSMTAQSGTVYCWGGGANSSTGNGTTTDTATPTPVCGTLAQGAVATSGCGGIYLTNIIALTNGDSSLPVCAISATGYVYCWGSSANYELGNNSTATTKIPVQVLAGAQTTCPTYLCHIVTLNSGYYSTCAVDDTAYVYCWGYNLNGQTGTGNNSTVTTPVKVLSGVTSGICGTYLCNVKDVAVSSETACALVTGGAVYCWGKSAFGNLGNNTVSNTIVTPVQVVQQTGGNCLGGNLCNITAIAGGDHSQCAMDALGRIFCWGGNDYATGTSAGIFGVSSTTASQSPIPRQVLNVSGLH